MIRSDSGNSASSSLVEQLDHAGCPLDGSNLIEAAAGTGKTYAITKLYLRLILEKELPVSKILVVTFTEAATRELKERLRTAIRTTAEQLQGGKDAYDEFTRKIMAQLDPARAALLLDQGLRSFDSAAIYTIHGFCRQVLVENTFETGTLPGSAMVTEERELQNRISADFWRRTMADASPWYIAFLKGKGCADPSWFRKLYESRQGPQEYRLIPAGADIAPTADLEVKCSALKSRVLDLWRAERGSVAAQLASPSLNKSRYKEHCIPGMLSGMDELLGLAAVDADQAEALVKFTAAAIRSATKKNQPVPEHRFFDLCEEFHAAVTTLHGAFEKKLLTLKISFLEQAGSALECEKERQAALGFDDLLVRVHRSLADAESGPRLRASLRREYHAALIDEFQDTDPVQFQIFDSIFGTDRPVFYIGDPKQAIYRFRGADIYAYFKAAQGASRRYTLPTNFRSDPALIDAVNAFFGSHQDPFAFSPVVYRRVTAGLPGGKTGFFIDGKRQTAFKLWIQSRKDPAAEDPLAAETSRKEIAAALTAEIAAILCASREKRAYIGTDPVQPSHIAVLVRTNAEAEMIHESLTAARIPAVISVSGSVFGSYEAWEFELLLAAVAEPARPALVKAALATSFFGLGPEVIAGLDKDDRQWSSYAARLLDYHDQWSRNGILCMIRHLMRHENLRERLLPVKDGERRITNYLHLAELLHADEVALRLGMGSMLKRLADRRAQSGDTVPPEEEMLRLDRDETAVKVVTIHKSKGLEYSIVFCPFNWNPSQSRNGRGPVLFHDPAAGFKPTLALDEVTAQRSKPLAEEEQLAENIRLLYVALTRAKSCCYCIWTSARGSETSALSWILFGRLLPETPPDAGGRVPALKSAVSKLSDKAAEEEIRGRFAGVRSIEILPLPEGKPPQLAWPETSSSNPVVREMKRPIPLPRRVLSYTSIVHSLPEEPLEFDEPELRSSSEPSVDLVTPDFRAFPRGSRAGIFLHELFEEVDFSRLSEIADAYICDKLSLHGFAPEWLEPVKQMLHAIAELPLNAATGLAIGNIPANRILKEMEFFFPAKPFMVSELLRCIGRDSSTIPSLPGLNLTEAGGHIKGSIDFMFEWQQRFYIIDWKSNFLGNTPEDYAPQRLESVMLKEHYDVQYHLYSVALHRFLTQWKQGYSFQKHFGGVYYLFLRGMAPGADASSGVFFDLPVEDRITRLAFLLGHETHNRAILRNNNLSTDV